MGRWALLAAAAGVIALAGCERHPGSSVGQGGSGEAGSGQMTGGWGASGQWTGGPAAGAPWGAPVRCEGIEDLSHKVDMLTDRLERLSVSPSGTGGSGLKTDKEVAAQLDRLSRQVDDLKKQIEK